MAVERIQPAYDGLDTDTAPDYLAATKTPVLDNFLVDRPGELPMRGPIRESIELYAGALAGRPVGVWHHNNNLLVGLKTDSAVAVREPWVSYYRQAAASGDLAEARSTMYHVALDTGVVTAVVAPSLDRVPGHRHTRLGGYVWGVDYQGAITTWNGGKVGMPRLLRWDGTATSPTQYSFNPTMNAPYGILDVRAYLNRLFALGGTTPGTMGPTTLFPSTLYWTDLGGPVTGAVTEWQDDVSGLTNQIVVESEDQADFGVALAKVGSGLAIFKRRAISLLVGRTTAEFALRPFSADIGCIDPRSVVEYEDGVFFMSDQGFMYFDGAELHNTTRDLRSTLLTEAIAMVGDTGVDGGYVCAGRLPNGYVGLSVGYCPPNGGVSTPRFGGIYHPGRRAWSSLSSDVMSAGQPVRYGRSLSHDYLVDDKKIFSAAAVTAPERAAEADRGYDEDGATTAPIPALWHSRLTRLSLPLQKARISRLLTDYKFVVDGGTDDQYSGWFVKLIDGQGNVLIPEFNLPSQGDPGSYVYRRQNVVDAFAEANDAQLVVEWRGTDLAIKEGSLYGANIEFEVAQQRRSG